MNKCCVSSYSFLLVTGMGFSDATFQQRLIDFNSEDRGELRKLERRVEVRDS